jgi:putative oxidoreductase
MTVVRRIARPLLSAMFISGGIDALRSAPQMAPVAQPVAPPIARRVPYLPDDPEKLVKINGAVQVGAGLMFALGRFPRLSAALLAGSLVPTTLAGHRFWEEEDATRRAQQRIHFLKNLSMLGGLMLAAVDTEGQPGLAWRARHASQHAAAGTRRTGRAARRETTRAAREARRALPV